MARRHKTKETIIDTRNPETGLMERTETRKDFTHVFKPEEFFMTYVSYLSVFMGIKSLGDAKVLAVLCDIAEYNTGVVSMNRKQRDRISELTGIAYSNLPRHLKALRDIGVLEYDRGDYTISAKYFWKGEAKVRNEILKGKGMDMVINLRMEEQSNELNK